MNGSSLSWTPWQVLNLRGPNDQLLKWPFSWLPRKINSPSQKFIILLGFLFCEWSDHIFSHFAILFVNALQVGEITLNSGSCFSCKTRPCSSCQPFPKATADGNCWAGAYALPCSQLAAVPNTPGGITTSLPHALCHLPDPRRPLNWGTCSITTWARWIWVSLKNICWQGQTFIWMTCRNAVLKCKQTHTLSCWLQSYLYFKWSQIMKIQIFKRPGWLFSLFHNASVGRFKNLSKFTIEFLSQSHLP